MPERCRAQCFIRTPTRVVVARAHRYLTEPVVCATDIACVRACTGTRRRERDETARVGGSAEQQTARPGEMNSECAAADEPQVVPYADAGSVGMDVCGTGRETGGRSAGALNVSRSLWPTRNRSRAPISTWYYGNDGLDDDDEDDDDEDDDDGDNDDDGLSATNATTGPEQGRGGDPATSELKRLWEDKAAMARDIENLKVQVHNLRAQLSNQPPRSFFLDVVDEVQERVRRWNNLMVFNYAGPDRETPRQLHAAMADLLDVFGVPFTKLLVAKRLGPTAECPVLLVFKSSKYARFIVENKLKLRAHARWMNVRIYEDRTPVQRNTIRPLVLNPGRGRTDADV